MGNFGCKKEITTKQVLKDWIKSELNYSTIQGGFYRCLLNFQHKYQEEKKEFPWPEAINLCRKLRRNQEPTDREWDGGLDFFYYYRGKYVIPGVVDHKVTPVWLLKTYSPKELIQFKDYSYRVKDVSFLIPEHSPREDQIHFQKHKEKCTDLTKYPGVILTYSLTDLSVFMVVDGNHRWRGAIRKNESMSFYVCLLKNEEELYLARCGKPKKEK